MHNKSKLVWLLGLMAVVLFSGNIPFVIAAVSSAGIFPTPTPTVEPLKPEAVVFKEFVDVLGLKVKYPGTAMIVDTNPLESQIPKEIKLKRQLKILFLASDSKKFYQIMVQTEEFDGNLSISRINDELEKDDQLKGIEEQTTILKSDAESMLLDMDSVVNGAVFKSKRKIICKKIAGLAKTKVYIISFLTTPDQYAYYQLVMNKIVEEAGFTENRGK